MAALRQKPETGLMIFMSPMAISKPVPPAGYNSGMAAATELYPDIDPFDTGWLDVGDGHRVCFEQVGRRDGAAAVYLHGGPGSGCSPRQRRFFDPLRYRAVLFDQRGCGRSTPRGETRRNTTEHLIADMERLRTHLGIERWLVAGGSWGASLAIAYAALHPERVSGLVLRGVFLTGRRDLEWFFQEAAAFVPDAWQDFAAVAPQRRRRNLLDYVVRSLAGSDPDQALRAAWAWERYEQALSGGPATPPSDAVPGTEAALRLVDKYRVQAHYLSRRCFLGEARLLHFTSLLQRIPAALVHGRLDLVCRPANAWRVHRTLHGSRLAFVPGCGHDPFVPAMARVMTGAIDHFAAHGDFHSWDAP